MILGYDGDKAPPGYYLAAIPHRRQPSPFEPIGPGSRGSAPSGTLIHVLVCEACGALVGNPVAHDGLCQFGKEANRVR